MARNASTESCRRGYEDFFLRRGPLLASRLTVNDWLEQEGLDKISPRMYGHYCDLHKGGHKEYIALNHFEYIVEKDHDHAGFGGR